MTFESYIEKYTTHKKETDAIAKMMVETGKENNIARAMRMMSCGTLVDGYVCSDCGEYHVRKTNLCRDRLCPNCGYVNTRKRAGKLYKTLEAVNELTPITVNHVVLTLPHKKDSDLRELMRTLTQGYGRMMRSEFMRPYILGSARGIEITQEGENGYHPHIHAIMVEDAKEPHLNKALVLPAWRDAAMNDDITQVSCDEAYDGTGQDDSWEQACLEAVKYAIKPSHLLHDGVDDIAAFANAVKGFRLNSTDGIIKNVIKRKYEPTEDNGECPDCHNTAPMQRAWMRWNERYGEFEIYNAPRYM